MSGLAGVCWRNGRPAVAADATLLLARMAHRGGRHLCEVRGAIAAGSLAASRPFAGAPDASDRPFVMLDGHIDNSRELSRQLALPPDASDLVVLTQAWHKWGRDCPSRLVGDFAFTIVQGQRVFAARDCAPYRAFYYRCRADRWTWASELAPLVERETPGINEGVVAEYLSDRIVSVGETLFAGVYRLPPGHALELTPAGAPRVWPYWRPDPRAEIHYRDQREYDEHFRLLFRAAVRCRLPQRERAAVWYSSGIDSSAVAIQVARLRDEGDRSFAGDPEAISIAVPGYDVDESPFFTRGAAFLRLASTVRPFHFGTAEDFAVESRSSWDIPPVPSMMGGRLGWEALSSRNIATSLTGFGGDDWFIGSQFALLDDVRSLRWRSAAARWRAERKEPFGFTARQLLQLAVWLHLKPGARAAVRRAMGWTATPAQVSRALARRVCLDDRLRAAPDVPPFRTLSRRQLFESATAANVVVTGEMHARMAARWRVTARHPFADRRLVEFALALPPEQLLRPGVPRHIVISAIVSQLPRDLYNRVDGVDYSQVMRGVMMQIGCRQIVEAAIRDLSDWIESAVLREMAQEVEQSNGFGVARQMWAIWQVFAIHTWWRAIHQPATAVTLERHEVEYGRAAVGQS